MSNLPARPRWYPIPTGNHDRDETDRRVLDMIYAEQDGRTNLSQTLVRQAQENQSLKASVSKLVAFVGSLKGYGAISENQQIANTKVLTPVNAAGTPTSSGYLTQSGTSTQINVATTSWQFPTGIVVYNSGSVDPGTYGTFYITVSDPYFRGGNVTYAATLFNPNLTDAEGLLYFGQITTTSAGGGTGGSAGSGGGGGGPCVTPDTLIQTPKGNVAISQLQPDDQVITLSGKGWVEQVLTHNFSGPIATLPSGVRITANHCLLYDALWVPAGLVYLGRADYTGPVHNLELEGDHTYILSDGTILHNALK